MIPPLALAGSLLVALAGATGPSPAPDPVEALLRAQGATGTTQQLVLVGEPRRTGQGVVLTAQLVLLGVPARGADAEVVALDPADARRLTATAHVTREGETPPRTAVLVVDVSGSMGAGGIEAARRAAQGYADAVGPGVRVGLVAISDRPHLLAAPTTDRAALRAGLGRLMSRGQTALYDALVLAAQQAGPKGNIVLLSDGGDTASRAGPGQALAALTTGGTRADVIAFKTAESDRGPLERIAAAGHGKVVAASDAAGLGRAFASAATAVPLDLTITVRTPADTDPRQIRLGLVVGGLPWTGSVDVPASGTSAASGASAAGAAGSAFTGVVERVSATPPWFTPWRFGGGLSAVLGLAVGVLAWPRSPRELMRQRRRQALRVYDLSEDTPRPESDDVSAVSVATAGVLRACARMVAAGGRQSTIALRLDRAGLALLPHEWVVLRTSVALTGGAGLLLLVHPRWVGLLLGGLLGWAATGGWLRRRQSRRCRAFAEQLPDTLQTVASSLRSGFSLQQALAATQETAAPPMSTELGRALAAARIGVVLEDELEQIATRMHSEDWRMAVMAIRIQRSVGGNLAEVLSTTARTLRERSAVVRQVRALSAEGRLSAYVLLGLPVGVGLFLGVFRRSYIEPLWTTGTGMVLLVVAAVGMVVGSAWMFKVAEVEV